MIETEEEEEEEEVYPFLLHSFFKQSIMNLTVSWSVIRTVFLSANTLQVQEVKARNPNSASSEISPN